MSAMTHRWVDLPHSARQVPLTALAEALSVQQIVNGAWLVGSVTRNSYGEEHTGITVALVVDDPSKPRDSSQVVLMNRLAEIAADLGLDVQNWAFVSLATAENAIKPCGLQIYPANA
jgi:hypothetical protein